MAYNPPGFNVEPLFFWEYTCWLYSWIIPMSQKPRILLVDESISQQMSSWNFKNDLQINIDQSTFLWMVKMCKYAARMVLISPNVSYVTDVSVTYWFYVYSIKFGLRHQITIRNLKSGAAFWFLKPSVFTPKLATWSPNLTLLLHYISNC